MHPSTTPTPTPTPTPTHTPTPTVRKSGCLRAWLFTLGLLTGVAGFSALSGCDVRSGYSQKGGLWHYGGTRQFNPADPDSFKPIDDIFAKDAQRGYYRGSVIESSHGKSFVVLSKHEARDARAVFYADTYRKSQEYYTQRHNHVFAIAGAQPSSYRVLAHGYARDAQRAYYKGHSFKVRDVESFEPLDTSYARDAHRGYHERIEIPGSHGASFALLDLHAPEFARDRAQVYHGHIDTTEPHTPRPVVRVLRGADVATVRSLGRAYVADAKQVWYRSEPVAGADAASFKVNEDSTSEFDASDGQRRYQQGRRVNDPKRSE